MQDNKTPQVPAQDTSAVERLEAARAAAAAAAKQGPAR
jgi:hypothetical protein